MSSDDSDAYVSLWEFRVQPGAEEEFERHYGPNGSWAALFVKSPGYLETLLLRDSSDRLRYLTVDRWRSQKDYRQFRSRFAREYNELDRRCEALTTHEAALGEFTEINRESDASSGDR